MRAAPRSAEEGLRELAAIAVGERIACPEQLEHVEHRLPGRAVRELAITADHLEEMLERVRVGAASGQRAAETQARVQVRGLRGHPRAQRSLVAAAVHAGADLGR